MSYEIDTKNAYRNEAKANAYKNQYTQGIKWARFTMWQQKKIITKFLDTCNLESEDKVLDIPCGAGYIGSVLAKYEASVVASDISEEMMELAKNEYNSEKLDGFIQADITKTPFPSDHFKCVIVLALIVEFLFDEQVSSTAHKNRLSSGDVGSHQQARLSIDWCQF